jgi:hypothetical protein
LEYHQLKVSPEVLQAFLHMHTSLFLIGRLLSAHTRLLDGLAKIEDDGTLVDGVVHCVFDGWSFANNPKKVYARNALEQRLEKKWRNSLLMIWYECLCFLASSISLSCAVMRNEVLLVTIGVVGAEGIWAAGSSHCLINTRMIYTFKVTPSASSE